MSRGVRLCAPAPYTHFVRKTSLFNTNLRILVKKVVSILSISALLFVGSSGLVAANAVSTPKPGSTCAMNPAMTGGSVIVKDKSYVCLPTARWSKALPASASALKTKDMWVKIADSGMTAAFGMITNPTKKDIRIIAARSNAFSTLDQLHQMTMNAEGTMVMQQLATGLLIPAGKTVELKPGGDHIMFMNLKKPITAGMMVPIMLIGSNGEQLRFSALGKVFAGANESYDPSHSGM
jgi:copper(I)-binding protein